MNQQEGSFLCDDDDDEEEEEEEERREKEEGRIMSKFMQNKNSLTTMFLFFALFRCKPVQLTIYLSMHNYETSLMQGGGGGFRFRSLASVASKDKEKIPLTYKVTPGKRGKAACSWCAVAL